MMDSGGPVTEPVTDAISPGRQSQPLSASWINIMKLL